MCNYGKIIELFPIILLILYICGMDLMETIRSYSTQPLTHQLMLSLLKEYTRPNDKLHALLSEGILNSIKKGLYIAGPALKTNRPEPFLLANHILGPSYVSVDSALSYYGLIPERVFEVASMTTKSSRMFNTPMGIFSFTHLPLPYYAFGVRQVRLANEQYAMVASPEKALFDKIVTTSGIVLRSQKNAMSYLVDDLRIDEESLKALDTGIMSAWLPECPKKESLSMAIKMIQRL
jgi:hypothetical protein